MAELSILIPARNEQFLTRTINNVLENIRGDTEIIAVLDGNWPAEPIEDHPRVTLLYYPQSIGQRAATNQAARVSTAKYIMKLDAHCALDEGFDVKLMAECDYDWTVVPRLYNLHAFDWQCKACGHRTYQGPYPKACPECQVEGDFEQVIVWQPRLSRKTDFMRFDRDLVFQYWGDYGRRPESQGDIADLMSFLGACWLMHRGRYWELGGLDEDYGSWGQMGTEISLKNWTSGGRLVVNKRTWYSHLFRTQPGFGFPYPAPSANKARNYCKDIWFNNKWEGQKYPLSWVIEKFWPIPGWDDEDLTAVQETARAFTPAKAITKGVVYYTDNRLDNELMQAVQSQLKRSVNGHEIVSVSLKPLDFGRNITLDLERGYLAMFRQILAGLEASTADVIFLAEHDILYHKTHFDFTPPDRSKIYYNTNVWHVRTDDGHAITYTAKRLSQLCAYRDVLIKHYRRRVAIVERDGFSYRMGFEPGTHGRKERVDDLKSDTWVSAQPNIDIKHGKNLTPARWSPEQFRDKRNCQDWQESRVIPGWGTWEEICRRFIK